MITKFQPKAVYNDNRSKLDKKLDLFEKVTLIKSVVESWYNTKIINNFIQRLKKKYIIPEDPKKKALFFAKWIKENVKYVPEPTLFNDRIRTPAKTIEYRFGDCTEHAILLATLLKNQNIPFVYALVSTNRKEPDVINHIYIEARVDSEKIPLDTTSKNELGENPRFFIRLYFK